MSARYVLTLLAGCLALSAAAAQGRAHLDERADLQAYRTYQGESFQVWGGQGARLVETLELIEVRDAGSNDRIQQFTLRFRAAPQSTLAKEAYRFRHPDSGDFTLWLEPAGADATGKFFEARFSLLPGEIGPAPARRQR